MDGSLKPVDASSAPTPAAPRVKSLKCSHCGAPLTVRGMERTEAIACEACGAVMDLTDENLRVLSTYQAKIKHRPLIPLGSRGKLSGDLLEVIGYMRRAVTVEGVDYEWSEYLLFNPYKGFRWLTEYNGHWSFVKTITSVPRPVAGSGRSAVKYLDKTFRLFQTAAARVVFVLGEFTWKVKAGDVCTASDYICPPLILSREKTAEEEVWSAGEYIEPETLWEAFRPGTAMPPKVGIAPNQPSPYGPRSSAIFKLFGAFLLGAVLVHIAFLALARNQLVYENHFVFRQEEREKALVTDPFEIAGRVSNVAVRSIADVNNGWIYLRMALVREDGRAYTFGREISYYHGVEDGGSWSEGNASDEAILPAVAPGKYYLRLEPESPAPAVRFTIRVYRDVPQWSFFLLALGALLVIPVFAKWRSSRFEAARWSESDAAGDDG